MWLTSKLNKAVRAIAPARARVALADALLQPWERPTLFGVRYAKYFPRFARGSSKPPGMTRTRSPKPRSIAFARCS